MNTVAPWFVAASSAITLLLGVMHLLYTFCFRVPLRAILLATTLHVLACLCLMTTPALACTAMPDHWRHDPQTMVASTPMIALAKVTSIRADGTWSTAQLVTVKAVRGEAPRTFSLRGWVDNKNRGDFSGHRDPRFWTLDVSNTVWPGDCGAYGVFSVGEMYLVFLGGRNYPRSFENIKSEDDLWYQTISGIADVLRVGKAR